MSWRDDLSSNCGMESCLVCSKTTRSHVVLLRYAEDAETLVVTEDLDEADAVGKVCHECYRSVDGDAERLVAEYAGYLRGLANAADVELEDLVRSPEDVDAEVDDEILEGGIR